MNDYTGSVYDAAGHYLGEWNGLGASIGQPSVPAYGTGVGYIGEWPVITAPAVMGAGPIIAILLMGLGLGILVQANTAKQMAQEWGRGKFLRAGFFGFLLFYGVILWVGWEIANAVQTTPALMIWFAFSCLWPFVAIAQLLLLRRRL